VSDTGPRSEHESPDPTTKPRSWKIDAVAAMARITDWREIFVDETSADSTETRAIGDRLSEAKRIIEHDISRSRPFRRLAAWWSGHAVESAWAALHEAEELLVLHARSGRSLELARESAMEHAKLLPEHDPARRLLFAGSRRASEHAAEGGPSAESSEVRGRSLPHGRNDS
jgi:hypothetical protein